MSELLKLLKSQNKGIERKMFIYFYRWQGEIYHREPSRNDYKIIPVSVSERSKIAPKIVKAACQDLASFKDGRWDFSVETGWIHTELSAIELEMLPDGDRYIDSRTPQLPLDRNGKYQKQIYKHLKLKIRDKSKGFANLNS